jgi:hypothetical protein
VNCVGFAGSKLHAELSPGKLVGCHRRHFVIRFCV